MSKLKLFETALKAISALVASGLAFVKFIGFIGKIMAQIPA